MAGSSGGWVAKVRSNRGDDILTRRSALSITTVRWDLVAVKQLYLIMFHYWFDESTLFFAVLERTENQPYHGLLKRWMKNYKSIVPNKGLICEHCMLWFTLDLHFYPLGAGFWAKRYEHDFLRIINLMTCTCFQTTRTIWLVSSPSESQEKNLIKGLPWDFLQRKVEITRVVKGDNKSCFQ